MLYLLLAILLAGSPSPVLSAPLLATEAPIQIATPDLQTFASTTARHYGLDPQLFHDVISCESHFDPTATSTTADFGVVQIHLSAHPGITLAEADDPYWAINWMAEQWSEKRQSEWTCYNNLTMLK